MRLYNKHVSWDAWTIYNPYTKCTKQDNNYDCGPITIKFIDLDTLGALLVFSHDMVRYREILQSSVSSVIYDYLGINKPKIPIVDFVPDKAQHLHDRHVSKIIEEKQITVDKVDVKGIRDDETNHNSSNILSEDELTDNFSLQD